jgi:SAM-dependent methyltransferase
METRVNAMEPPSPYPDDNFDLVYAVSVLTHLTPQLADAWIADFARVLRPGGLLFVTTHGDPYRSKLTSAERARYDRGEPVVQRSRMAGANACAAYHPSSYVTGHLLRGFELLSVAGDDPDPPRPHDVYLARFAPGGV